MKFTKIIFAVTLLMFLVACGGESSGGKAVDYNFKQGVAGVNIKFLDNAPPDKLYPNSNFKIITELHNQQAYKVHDGKLKLIGLNPQYFTMDVFEHTLPTLEGKSLVNPVGDREFIEFPGKANKLFQNAVRHNGPYFLKLSYKSFFEFTETVCLNPNLYAIYDSGCKIEERKSYSGQGAPIGVKAMEEVIYPGDVGGEVEFRLQVGNLGPGKVNKINFEQAHLGGKKIDCEFQGSDDGANTFIFKQKKQEVILVCRSPLTSSTSYTTTLQADFNFEYEVKQKHTLNLIDPNAQSAFR